MKFGRMLAKNVAMMMAIVLLCSIAPYPIHADDSQYTGVMPGQTDEPLQYDEQQEVLQAEETIPEIGLNAASLPENLTQTFSFTDVSNISIRIEADETLQPLATIPLLSCFDLTPYGLSASSNPDHVTPLHALIYIMENELGVDTADKDVLKLASSGYINGLFYTENESLGRSWLYAVNDVMPETEGISEYVLQDGDCITIFYTDWLYGYYSYFDRQALQVAAGEPVLLTLTGENIMYAMFGMPLGAEPIENAEIYISAAESGYATEGTGKFTDENGQVELFFDTPGEYVVSAVRYSEDDDDIIDISRPYCKIIVSDGGTSGKKVSVRIEGNDKTLMPKTEVTVDHFDLTPYGVTGVDPGETVALHALIQALKDSGNEPANSNVLNGSFSNEYGYYLMKILGIENAGDFAWMYIVNDHMLWESLDSYRLNDDDDIVFYYMNWNGKAVFFDISEVLLAQGEYLDLTLKGLEWDGTVSPVADAAILISEDGGTSAERVTDYKTDGDGNVTISFTEQGEYILSAVRMDNDGSFIDISRPYCKVTVADESTVPERADKTALNQLIKDWRDLSGADYTEASWDVFKNALTNAQTISKKIDATQQEVNKAADALQTAFNGLVGVEPGDLDDEVIQTALHSISQKYAAKTNKNNGDYLSDWEAFGLAVYGQKSSVQNAPGFVAHSIQNAYSNVNLVMTDIERCAMAITSLGLDARNAADGRGNRIDLIDTIANYDKPSLGTWNAYIYALLAYDSGEYTLPQNAVWTREKIIDDLMEAQKNDGGWSLSSGAASQVETTAMAISALAKYKDDARVNAAVGKGIQWLSNKWKASGGFGDTCEYYAQALTALCAVEMDEAADPDLIKDVLIKMMGYQTDGYDFRHTMSGKPNSVATEQAFYALAAYERFVENGQNPVNIYLFGPRAEDVRNVSVTVHIEIDGKDIVPGYKFTAQAQETPVTVLDAAKAALSGLQFESNDDTIVSVEGNAESGSKGFYYTVNNVVFDKTMKDFIIFDGDHIYIYYGKKGMIPVGLSKMDVVFDKDISDPKLEITANKPFPDTITTQNGYQMQIAAGTEIIDPAGYHGDFMVPRAVRPTLSSDKRLIAAVQAGTDSGSITFSKPIRLFIPGAAATEAGFINASGNITPITVTLGDDTFEKAEEMLTGAVAEAKYKTGEGMAIWTKHFTTFATYSLNTGGGGSQQENSVYISVADPNPAGVARTFLSMQGYPHASGMTVLDLLNATGLAVDSAGGYVRGIKDLNQFDEGPESGWMYRVNGGDFEDEAADRRVLEPGDYVEWLYTRDYGKDLGYAGNLSSNGSSSGSHVPQVSLDTIHANINKMIEKISKKTEKSDWESLCTVLNGNTISEAKLTEIKERIKENGGDFRVATDLARTAILLQAAGIDITDFEGINLLEKIYNNDNLGRQGTNGYIFSLIVMSNAEEIPNEAKMSIDKIITEILAVQRLDGGFPLSPTADSHPDISAMALQALAPYADRTEVKRAIDKGLAYFGAIQNTEGFGSDSGVTQETLAQLIIALTSLGINPDDETYLNKEGTLMQVLLTYQNADGGFSHIMGRPSDDIATEHGLLAMIAYANYFEKKNPVYVLGDKPEAAAVEASAEQAPADKATPADSVFDPPNDMNAVSSWAKPFVEKAYTMGIVKGDDQGNFNPGSFVTRAEFVTMFLNSISEAPGSNYSEVFHDVNKDAWYTGHVEKAAELGIINGVGGGNFAPGAAVTRQDMAVIIANYYNLSGAELVIADSEKAADYAKAGIAAVLEKGVMSGVGGGYFDPTGLTTREMAVTVIVNIQEQLEGDNTYENQPLYSHTPIHTYVHRFSRFLQSK